MIGNEERRQDEHIDYREKIIEMVNHIENEDYIFKIFHYVLAKYRRDKEGVGN